MSPRIDVKTHKIMDMDADKRARLLNAAMTEFCKGFRDASTDTIVREAGISKGLLFHYFGTKEALYRFLIWYGFDLLVTEYFDLLNKEQSDLLERVWQMLLLKMDLSYKYPAIFEFMAAAFMQEKENPRDKFAEEYMPLLEGIWADMYKNTDLSLFKDGVDVEKAGNIIRWTMLGYSDSMLKPSKKLEDYQKEYETYLAEMETYFAILRKAFYK